MAKTKAKSRKGKAATKAAPRSARAPAKPAPPARTAPVKAPFPVAAIPAPPPLPPPRDELAAPRDVARLTRYGERFGPHKIDVRFLQNVQLPVGSGAIALFDPGAPKTWRVLDRPVGAGIFRVMVSVARSDDARERLAAVTIHVGRPPIARWTVAHFQGQKRPKSADQLPRCAVTTGWLAVIDAGDGAPGVVAVPEARETLEIPLTDGRRALALPTGNGEFVAYWAVDSMDKPICLVVDFDVLTQKEWKARPPT